MPLNAVMLMYYRKLHFFSAFLLFLFALMCGSNALAQRTLEDKEPETIYNKGLELFNGRYYAASQKQFTQYLRESHTRESNRINAKYFIAVSAVELFQNDAEVLLLNFLTEYPGHPYSRYVYYHLGKYYFRNNDWKNAGKYFDQVEQDVLADDEAAEYLVMAGYTYFKLNDNKKAMAYFQRAKSVPGDLQPFAIFYYGYSAYKEGKYNEALIEFEKIKDNKKFKSQIPIYIGQIYVLQGAYSRAITYVSEILNRNEEIERKDELRLVLGEAYFQEKNYKKTAEALKSFSGTLSDHYLYLLGYSQFVNEAYQDAIAAFSSINIQKDSIGQNITYHLGMAYLYAGDKFKARNAFAFASGLKFNKQITEISLYNIAKLDYENGDTQLATEEVRKFIADYPTSSRKGEAQGLLSEILLAADNPKEAYEILKSIPDRNKDLNSAWQYINYLIGTDLYRSKQYDEARKYFREAIATVSDNKVKAKALFWMGEMSYRENDIKTAITNYKLFINAAEANATQYYSLGFYNLGYCYFAGESYSVSADYFKRYLQNTTEKKSKRFQDATLRVADCQFMERNYPAALQSYDNVIASLSSESDYALYQKAVIYNIQNKTDLQISTLRSLIKNYPGSNLLDDAQFAIAEAYNNSGNFKQAIREFESLNYNYPKNPYLRLAMLQTGQAYYNLDNEPKAKSIFNQIIQKYPYSEEAKLAYQFLENIIVQNGNTEELDSLKSNLPKAGFVMQSSDSTFYATAFNNYAKGNCESAEKAFKSYINKFPNAYYYADAYYYMAQCAIQRKSYIDAVNALNVVLARAPNAFVEQALRQSADIYYLDKNFELALARYTQLESVATKSDNLTAAIIGEVRSAWQLKSYEKVDVAAAKLISNASIDEQLRREAQLMQAKALLEMNQQEKALQGFSLLSSQDKTEIGAEATYYKAWIQFQNESLKDAEATIDHLKNNFKSYDYWRAKGLILLADIYIKTGDDFQAKAILQSIVERYKRADGEELRAEAKRKLDQINKREGGK